MQDTYYIYICNTYYIYVTLLSPTNVIGDGGKKYADVLFCCQALTRAGSQLKEKKCIVPKGFEPRTTEAGGKGAVAQVRLTFEM